MDGIFRRRRLPHWDVEDATYFVTACLDGSIPAKGWLRLQNFREQLDRQPQPQTMSAEEWEIHKHKRAFVEFDKILDHEPAVRHFADPIAAAEMEETLRYFAGDHYDLLAFVVMPSHFHWVFHPRNEWIQACVDEQQISGKTLLRTPRQRIMQSVKGYSARNCNKLLGLQGEFWQDESYDHVIRSDDELGRIIEYIENNPVNAGLVKRQEDWLYSSAFLRAKLKIPYGSPLPKRCPS